MKNQRLILSGLYIALLMALMQTSYGQLANYTHSDLSNAKHAQGIDKDPIVPILPPPVFLGNEELTAENSGIGLYPNPCVDYLTVARVEKEPIELSIYSLTGTIVWKGKISDKGTIDIAHLHRGIYLLHDGNHSYKFQKL